MEKSSYTDKTSLQVAISTHSAPPALHNVAKTTFYVMVGKFTIYTIIHRTVAFVQLYESLGVCSTIHGEPSFFPTPYNTVLFTFQLMEKIFGLLAEPVIGTMLPIHIQHWDYSIYYYHITLPLFHLAISTGFRGTLFQTFLRT